MYEKAIADFTKLLPRSPIDWKLEVKAALSGNPKPFIASLRAGKPIDGSENAKEVRNILARWLAGEIKRHRGAPKRAYETNMMVPWGRDGKTVAEINSKRDSKLYAAARFIWKQRSENSSATSLSEAARKFGLSQESLSVWMRRSRRRGRVSEDT